VLPIEEDKGERGTLIITYDTKIGGINSDEIKQLIKKVFL